MNGIQIVLGCIMLMVFGSCGGDKGEDGSEERLESEMLEGPVVEDPFADAVTEEVSVSNAPFDFDPNLLGKPCEQDWCNCFEHEADPIKGDPWLCNPETGAAQVCGWTRGQIMDTVSLTYDLCSPIDSYPQRGWECGYRDGVGGCEKVKSYYNPFDWGRFTKGIGEYEQCLFLWAEDCEESGAGYEGGTVVPNLGCSIGPDFFYYNHAAWPSFDFECPSGAEYTFWIELWSSMGQTSHCMDGPNGCLGYTGGYADWRWSDVLGECEDLPTVEEVCEGLDACGGVIDYITDALSGVSCSGGFLNCVVTECSEAGDVDMLGVSNILMGCMDFVMDDCGPDDDYDYDY